ncbi:MAG: hypothetical protein OHK0038_01900 [Flammeovirgaceae bacterium]
MRVLLTSGNKADNNAKVLTELLADLEGNFYGDKGYYKRGIIEAVMDTLKNVCQLEHTRHGSPKNFLVNLWAGIIAYKFLDKKNKH